uniref:Uncharacterized protein n=1 Tax=Rhizophora mucronata TaxID=61149 RepID=A0A2P2PIS3_RHIMU
MTLVLHIMAAVPPKPAILITKRLLRVEVVAVEPLNMSIFYHPSNFTFNFVPLFVLADIKFSGEFMHSSGSLFNRERSRQNCTLNKVVFFWIWIDSYLDFMFLALLLYLYFLLYVVNIFLMPVHRRSKLSGIFKIKTKLYETLCYHIITGLIVSNN